MLKMIYLIYLKLVVQIESIQCLVKHLKAAIDIIDQSYKRDGKIAGLPSGSKRS